MTSFTALSQYAPHLVALAGLFWFAGLWGLGRAICASTGLRLTSPWLDVVAVLLGIQTVSLVIQILGMAGMASRPILIAIWGLLAALGVAATFLAVRRWRPVLNLQSPLLVLLLAIPAIAIAAGLLVAVAPSTKIDEIYYHMLVPGRILADGALHFYRAPWVAAIWPQLAYQIASTPLHAIGYPDAPNVASWALSALLLSFAWYVARAGGASPYLAALVTGVLSVGLYPVVWYGNGGAHAMGDLAMTAAIVAFAQRESLILQLGRARFAVMTSILLLSAVTSKISLLPICVVLLGLSASPLLRLTLWPERVRLLAALLLPWLIFYLPILVWTWAQSGSPFGPMMAGDFGPSIYSLEQIHAALRHAQRDFQPTFSSFLFAMAVNYSPLVWLGALGVMAGIGLPRGTALPLAAIFLVQCAVIYFLLPHDTRFLGGLHFGILLVCAAHVGERFQKNLTPRVAAMIGAVFLVPWLGAQLFYAQAFFPVALGLERTSFYQRYVAYFDDYVALDKLLPRDAVLLAVEGHTSAAYAPRPIYFSPLDLPSDSAPVLFVVPLDKDYVASAAFPYKLAGRIYENGQARQMTYRTGRAPVHGKLEVWRLQK